MSQRKSTSSRVVVSGKETGEPLAHYSPAIVHGQSVYCSGALGTDPQSGALVPGGIEAQTRQALRNLETVLTLAGSSLAELVKVTCYLARADDFPGFDAAYRNVVPDPPPARATVGVTLMVEGALVELEAIAALISRAC